MDAPSLCVPGDTCFVDRLGFCPCNPAPQPEPRVPSWLDEVNRHRMIGI